MTPQGPAGNVAQGRPNALQGHGPQSPAVNSPGGRWQEQQQQGFAPQGQQQGYGGMPQSAGGYGRGNGPATPGGWGAQSAGGFGNVGNGFGGYQQ